MSIGADNHTRAGTARAVACAIACSVLTLVRPAAAYRTAGDSPRFHTQLPVNWASAQITFQLNNQVPAGMAVDEMLALVARATAAWETPACSGVAFTSDGVTSAPARAGDKANTVQWLFSGWEAHGFPADSPGATDLLYEKGSDGRWRIIEADLYLNAGARDWVPEPPVAKGETDVLSVLTHELGHVAGLTHPCELQSMDGAPLCDKAAPSKPVTMYPLYSAEQSTLASDDIDGICFLYPASDCGSSCPADMFCSSDGCLPRCGGSICARGEECTDGACSVPTPTTPCSTAADPSCENPCEVDADCPADALCAAGRCLHRSAPGDPCAEASDCVSAACNDDGVCVSGCTSDRDCAANSACEEQASGNKTCEATARPFGASCQSADDCAGGQCVARLSPEPTCTRLCGEDYPAAPTCPAGWACSLVEARHVCTPPRSVASGCQIAPGAGSDIRAAFASLVAFMVVGCRRRKGRRRAGELLRQSACALEAD